nr:hypothetical protein TIFTF001_048175 [Ficus carica]
MLDLIQGAFLSYSVSWRMISRVVLNCKTIDVASGLVFVETLDKCFRNVCELDIVFNYSKMHTMLDEIIFGGQVLETSSSEVMKAVEEISKYTTALYVRDSFEFYIIPCPKICFWLAESVANVHR